MVNTASDIAQESAANFLSEDIMELVERVYDEHGWNESYIVKISKRDQVKRIVRTHLSAFPVKPGMVEYLKENIGIAGSFCLYVKRRPKEIKHIWNLPFERLGGIFVPDGRTSSLILDSVSKLDKGNQRFSLESYATIGRGD